jgi:hypothetical protein
MGRPGRRLTVDDQKTPGGTAPFFAVRHYSVTELSKMWNLSQDSVRRLFEKEPGVIVMGEHKLGSRRAYRTLRIPEPVAARVYEKMSA